MKLSVIRCYALAWKSFSKWWIPLCLISGVIVVFQILPRVLVHADLSKLAGTVRTLATCILENDLARLEEISAGVTAQTAMLIKKLAMHALYIFPVVAFLGIVLLMYANRAVKDGQEGRKPFAALVYITFVHVILAVGKGTAALFFFIPGVYLYIKLLFVSLVMLEEGKGATEAIGISWKMTAGNFWELLLLILMNAGLQLAALPTIIGTVPVTGFANTARAAAFRMIREGGSE